jgi:hypothetical protein
MFSTLLEIRFDEELENIYVWKYFPEIPSKYSWDLTNLWANNVFSVREGRVTVWWFKDCYKIKPRLSFYLCHNVLGTYVCLSRDTLDKEFYHISTIYEANTRFACYEYTRNCCLYTGKLIEL